LPLVAKGELSGVAKGEAAVERSDEAVKGRRGLTQIVDEIADSDFVILVDDFHYMERSVQQDVAKALKEAVRLGVKIVTASVSHRGDDVVRANPELRGRVRAINLKYWDRTELKKIALSGFAALDVDIDPPTIKKFIDESAGSLQLMQLLCLQACFVLDIRERQSTTLLLKKKQVTAQGSLSKILEQTSASTDFRSLIDVLDAGREPGGPSERPTDF